MGAFVNVVCHDDVDTARALASGGMSTFARFNVMHGTTHGPMGDDARDLLQDVHDAYDMRAHTQAGSPQAERLTSEFAAGFAVLGPPERCIARLQELTASRPRPPRDRGPVARRGPRRGAHGAPAVRGRGAALPPRGLRAAGPLVCARLHNEGRRRHRPKLTLDA